MFCKTCQEDISPECVLTTDECVFCHYRTDTWDCNGHTRTKKSATINYWTVFENYLNFYKTKRAELVNIVKSLPKGSVIRKAIKGKPYYYLVKRNGNKVVFGYLGKEKPNELESKITKRRFCLESLKEIDRILYILRQRKRPNTKVNRWDILSRDGFVCHYCGMAAPEVKLEVDHIIPVNKGGTDEPNNLIVACQKCNSQKRDKKLVTGKLI